MAAPDQYSPIAAAEPPSGLLLPPLLLALGVVFGMFLTLLAVHFLLKSLRVRAREPPSTTASSSQTSREPACCGVDSKVLGSLPVHAYSRGHELLLRPDHHQSECCVCLSALEEGAPVRALPACRHVFHRRCIDAWFASHSTCPFCRAEVTAAPFAAEPFAAEPFAVRVDATDGPNDSLAREYCQNRRSNSSVWPSDSS